MHNAPNKLAAFLLLLLATAALAGCSTQQARTANKSTAALSDNASSDSDSSTATTSDDSKLTLTANSCTSIITLIDDHRTEVEALCSLDGLVAKDIARDDQGCGYGEARSLTLACFAPSPNDPTPPARP